MKEVNRARTAYVTNQFKHLCMAIKQSRKLNHKQMSCLRLCLTSTLGSAKLSQCIISGTIQVYVCVSGQHCGFSRACIVGFLFFAIKIGRCLISFLRAFTLLNQAAKKRADAQNYS